MAKDTPLSLRNSTMYSVFVRNYSDAGTFRALEEDLPRIRALGTDIRNDIKINETFSHARLSANYCSL